MAIPTQVKPAIWGAFGGAGRSRAAGKQRQRANQLAAGERPALEAGDQI